MFVNGVFLLNFIFALIDRSLSSLLISDKIKD